MSLLSFLLILLFVLCCLIQFGIGNKKALKGYARILWSKIVYPLFQYHFVLTEQKILVYFFRTIAGISALSFACNIVVQTEWFQLSFDINAPLDFYGLMADLITLIGYGLYLYFDYKKIVSVQGTDIARNVVKRCSQISHSLVEANIKSGKYIPETYLEVDEYKDALRFFSDPVHFHGLVQQRAARFNFDFINYKRRLEERECLNYQLPEFGENIIALSNIASSSRCQDEYLSDFIKNLRNNNEEDHKSHMIERFLEQYRVLEKPICLITSDAGRGKTNFLCDLVRNTLVKRSVPLLYVNAFQLNSDNIADSLARTIYPFNNLAFGDILRGFDFYCHKHEKPLVIIIDGLNENPKTRTFASSMASFLNEICLYDYVRVIMTCRTEYYEHNFRKALVIVEKQIVRIENLFSRLSDVQKDRILDGYLHHFQIRADFSETVERQLTDNFLLLRIFSEAYEKQSLGFVASLYKVPLFNAYYEKMCSQVANRMSDKMSLAPLTIKSFFIKVVSLMVTRGQFMNIPLDDVLLQSSADERETYLHFLDENVLLRKDLMEKEDSNIFRNQEVINFTYDEFRDFLVSEYIVSLSNSWSKEELSTLITQLTQEDCLLAEGLRTFIFLTGHRNAALEDILSKQHWYEKTFVNKVWSIPDSEILDRDVVHLKQVFPAYDKEITRKLVLEYWDVRVSQKLNICILLEILNQSDKDGIMKVFNRSFSFRRQFYRDENKTEQELLLDQLQKVVVSDKCKNEPSVYRYLMLFVLYLASFNYRARRIYSEYEKLYPQKDELRRISSSSKCKELVLFINCDLLGL